MLYSLEFSTNFIANTRGNVSRALSPPVETNLGPVAMCAD